MNMKEEMPRLMVGTSGIDTSDDQLTLADYLASLPDGLIENSGSVERLLAKEWRTLNGSDEGGMSAMKLAGRCEDLKWSPPELTFRIERHGALQFGSSRAELQHWWVNPFSKTAGISKQGFRQMTPMDKRLNVGALAEGVTREVVTHQKTERLKWHSDGRVKILVRQIIPETNQRTTTDRRSRFRNTLAFMLKNEGWEEIGVHVYRKTKTT